MAADVCLLMASGNPVHVGGAVILVTPTGKKQVERPDIEKTVTDTAYFQLLNNRYDDPTYYSA